MFNFIAVFVLSYYKQAQHFFTYILPLNNANAFTLSIQLPDGILAIKHSGNTQIALKYAIEKNNGSLVILDALNAGSQYICKREGDNTQFIFCEQDMKRILYQLQTPDSIS